MRSYNNTKINLPIHAFLRMNDLTYTSWKICDATFPNFPNGARHVAPHISDSRCLWRILNHFRLKDSQTWDARYTLTNKPTLSLQLSNQNHIAFCTCKSVTNLSSAARAVSQSQLCVCFFFFFLSWIGLVIFSARNSALISNFIFDILQIPSRCSAPTCPALAVALLDPLL